MSKQTAQDRKRAKREAHKKKGGWKPAKPIRPVSLAEAMTLEIAGFKGSMKAYKPPKSKKVIKK